MKYSIIKLLVVVMISTTPLINLTSYAQGTIVTTTENKQFIKEVFVNVTENMDANEDIYAKFFSKSYIQHVDGKTLNYSDFVSHMKVQKAVMKSVKITFKYMVAERDKVATVHVVDGIKKDGGIIEAQVNAIFQIKDNKIVLCDELTHLIKGEKADRDLGSRQ